MRRSVAPAAEEHAPLTPEAPGVDEAAKGGTWIQDGLAWTARINIEHRNVLLGVFSVFLVVFAIGTARVEIDTNYMKDYWESSRIFKDTVKIDSEMGGTTNVIYLFDSGEDDGINPLRL